MKIIHRKNIQLFILAAILSLGVAVNAQQGAAPKPVDHGDCPGMKEMSGMKADDHTNNSAHYADVMKSGEKEMGFSQTATTHHFLVMKDGGAIQVEVNDAGDSVNREKIRAHLKIIAKQFGEGIFTTPFAVHGQVPAGVPAMEQLKESIRYKYEETKNGARVRILSTDLRALSAIHEFLSFQIEEHRTGDPVEASN